MNGPLLAVGDEMCIGCLRWRLYQMHAAARVALSGLLTPGDLIVLAEGRRHLYLRLCGGCKLVDVEEDGFEALLERLRKKEHPEYGTLSWNGREREITETVQFESDCAEPDEAVRNRAVRYLEGLTGPERAAADIDIVFRGKKPVRAILRAGTSELNPERLTELRRRVGLSSG